ncbi:MAG: hypothetical protein HND46_02690 [Chloroflexi bacterium]|nr:hypothetical protein [Chloroflexota bacterium]NOG62304.1 hypothetical protein [Chloroflexota bacterium]
MDTAQDFVNLFVDSTGELLYFIGIFVIYMAALFMALGQRMRSKEEWAAGRYTVGLFLVQLVWVSLMLGSLVGIVTEDDSMNILPPLERAANALALVLIGWALITAEKEKKDRFAGLVAFALCALLIAGLAYNYSEWNPDQDFNTQSFSLSWTFVPTVLAIFGFLLLITRYKFVADIPLKLLFFVTILVGHIYTLYQLANEKLEGDAAGGLRWTFLAGSLLVMVVVYRMVIDRLTNAIDQVAHYAESISRPFATISPSGDGSSGREIEDMSRAVTADTPGVASLGGRNEALEIIKSLGTMLDKAETDALPRQTVMAVADAVKADVVALVVYEDANWADVIAAYNQSEREPITGMSSLNLEEQPTLVNAIETRRQRELKIEDHGEELLDLYTRLDVPHIGPTYLQPLIRNQKVVGVLIVGTPYTRRELRVNDLRLLESIGPLAARLLVISRTAFLNRVQAEERAILSIIEGDTADSLDEGSMMAARQEMQASLTLAENQINHLTELIRELQIELDYERSRIREFLGDDPDAQSITQRIEAISKERLQLQSERHKLAIALQEARATLVGVTSEGDVEMYERLIEAMRRELGDLQTQKTQLEQQIAEVRAGKAAPPNQQLLQMLNTLTEEKVRIAFERDSIAKELEQTRSELNARGIEGGALELTKQLAQLSEERAQYKTLAEKAISERDALLKERQNLETAISQENERDSKIAALEAEIARLMQDREAIAKSRGSLKNEYQTLVLEREQWQVDRARMIAHNDSLKMELDETLALLNKANEERQELSSERVQLNAERDNLRAELTRLQTEYDTLLARLEDDRERLEELNTEGVGTLTGMIEELTRERTDLEQSLIKATEDIESYKRQIEKLSIPPAVPVTVNPSSTQVESDAVISVAQELRTPLSVIMGYTDVLLGESVGILGALQRQFLTRVKANVDRLARLVEDLIRISTLDSGNLRLHPQKLNLVDLIDDAITNSRYKFGEKGIVLDMDIAEDNLPIEADPEAIQQVINQLIQNAYLVSPNDGSVRVVARHEASVPIPSNNGHSEIIRDVVYVAISDEGGGVPPEELKRVFSGLYRADSPLIAGLGETGAGMSIARALIEAHGGKIWIESTQGVGNTFKFILPSTHPYTKTNVPAEATKTE